MTSISTDYKEPVLKRQRIDAGPQQPLKPKKKAPPNIFTVLMERSIGRQLPMAPFRQKRIVSNLEKISHFNFKGQVTIFKHEDLKNFSVQNNFLVTSSWNDSITVFDIMTKTALWTAQVAIGILEKPIIHSESDTLIVYGNATGRRDNQIGIQLFSLKTGEMKGRIDPFDATEAAARETIAVFEQELYLLLGNTIKRWDLQGAPLLPDITVTQKRVYSYVTLPRFIFHLKKAILLNKDNRNFFISIWTVGENRPDHYPLEGIDICTGAVAWDRSIIFGMTKKGKVGLSMFHLDSLKQEEIYEENSHDKAAPIAITIGKTQLFLGKYSGRIRVYDLLEKKALDIDMFFHTNAIRALSIHNHDEILVSHCDDKMVLWNLKTFTPISTLMNTPAPAIERCHLTMTQNSSKLFLDARHGIEMLDCLMVAPEVDEEKEAIKIVRHQN